MRKAIIAFLVWLLAAAAECMGQDNPIPVFPMVWIDERSLPQYPAVAYNRLAWDDARQCLMENGIIPPSARRILPPVVRVVPFASSFRVHDITLDSLLRSEDSTSLGMSFTAPTIAYALMHSNIVLVTTPYANNFRVLRHEAIHVLLWWGLPLKERGKWYGHPPQAFQPCDRERPVPPDIP